MANKVGTKKKGGFAKFTYFVALLCLIAGLVLPLGFKFDSYLENMLGWQLPAAINAIIGKNILTFGASVFALSHPVKIWGALSFDLGAWLVALYGVFTVLGIIWLLFVLPGKKARSVLAKASFIEIFALLFLTPLMYILLVNAASAEKIDWIYYMPLIIAAGGTFLMALLQSFAYRKGSGLMKLIMFLLSTVLLLYCIFPLTTLIPALASPLANIDKLLNGKLIIDGLYADGGIPVSGLDYITTVFHGALTFGQGMAMVMDIAVLAVAALVFINATLDIVGMAKTSKKLVLVINIFRYLLELIAAGTVIAMVFVLKYTLGLPVCVIAVVAFLQFLFSIFRLSAYKKRVKRAKEQRAKQQRLEQKTQMYGREPTKGYTSDAAAANAYLSGADERRAAADKDREAKRKEKEERREKERLEREAKEKAEADAQAAALSKKSKSEENVYNVTQIYKGPTDEFIKELTNDEKIEFAQTFLERRNGPLPEIPDYIIGGNNDKFFSSIFIYYGRMRDRISDGLMGKLYDQGYRR